MKRKQVLIFLIIGFLLICLSNSEAIGVNPPSGIQSITLNLTLGWNGVSCPGDPLISTWSTITAGNSNIVSIVVYDITVIPKRFVPAINIEFGKSYFIAVTNDTSITLEYAPRSSLTLSPKLGWNSLGSVSVSIPKSNITITPPNNIASLVYFDKTLTPQRFAQALSIEPFGGYMLACFSDSTLSMGSSAAPPLNQKIVTKPSWESILSVRTQADHRELVFGMNRSASDGIDLFDRPIPPLLDMSGNMNTGWLMEDSAFDLLQTSFVKDDSKASWKLSVELSENGELSWANLPKAYSFTLLYGNQVVNMHTERSLSLPIGKHVLTILLNAIDDKPDKTSLLASYPNPCNPETWIPYELSKDTTAKIIIYSSNGNLVRRLDLGYKPVGRYIEQSKAAYWDGKNESGEKVSSGVYFYTLVTSDFSQIRKLLIIR